MIKSFIKNWLGITELEKFVLPAPSIQVGGGDMWPELRQGVPSYPPDDPHEPVIVEKPKSIVKGYVS